MYVRRSMFLVTILCSFPTSLSADEPPRKALSRIVGSVYGKTVTADDIALTAPIDPAVEFDARDSARWELMTRINTTFGGPVLERFVERKKIKATADEIERFQNNLRKTNENKVR